MYKRAFYNAHYIFFDVHNPAGLALGKNAYAVKGRKSVRACSAVRIFAERADAWVEAFYNAVVLLTDIIGQVLAEETFKKVGFKVRGIVFTA